MYSLFNEQFYPGTKTQYEGYSGFKIIKAEQDGIKLLGIIQEIMCRVQQHLKKTCDMVKA